MKFDCRSGAGFAFIFVLLIAIRSFAQDFRSVHDGIEHVRVEHRIGVDPVIINLLRLDPEKVRLDVHHALDKAIGLETTSSIAKRMGAVAAINGGFFRLDRSEFAGDAAGVLMIDGVLVSESINYRAGVVIRNGKRYSSVFFNHINAYADLQIGGPGNLRSLTLSGINRERKKTDAVLYTPFFGESTRTENAGTEISLSRCKTGKIIGSFRETVCRRAERVKNPGNTNIPLDGYVVSIGPEFLYPDPVLRSMIDRIREPRDKNVKFRIRHPILLDGGQFTVDKTIDITNGLPLLIRNGKIDITWEREKASKDLVEVRHPRTAMARLQDGKLLMITVDGRQPGISAGMTLLELAEYLLSLGATNAINLDGGGSTTMFLNGKVVNQPSDKGGERKVGDAIIVTLRTKRGKNR